MKNFITFINIGVVFLLGWIFSENTDNSTEKLSSETTIESSLVNLEAKAPMATAMFAKAENNMTNVAMLRDDASSDFIKEISEARMMDMEEGRLAQQRATSRILKDYGTLMIADQTLMLRDLKKIAKTKHISLPKSLGEDKADGLAELKGEHGENFDSKFIKMMIIDHKRDIRKLQNATISPDADIKVFATHYLPAIKSHLEKIEAIKKK